MPRFVNEFANNQIRFYENLKKEYPHNRDFYDGAIGGINHAVSMCERGLISICECMKIIADM
jgi:hypothetical protein